MIKFRSKSFSFWLADKIFRRDPMPNERFDGSDRPDLEIDVISHRTKKFNKDLESLIPSDRKLVKDFIKDIENGNIYGHPGDKEDTHFLSDFSKKDVHVLSKTINYDDRFNYRVKRPVLVDNPDGTEGYLVEITYDSCKGHELNGTPDYIKDKNYRNLKKNKNPNNDNT